MNPFQTSHIRKASTFSGPQEVYPQEHGTLCRVVNQSYPTFGVFEFEEVHVTPVSSPVVETTHNAFTASAVLVPGQAAVSTGDLVLVFLNPTKDEWLAVNAPCCGSGGGDLDPPTFRLIPCVGSGSGSGDGPMSCEKVVCLCSSLDLQIDGNGARNIGCLAAAPWLWINHPLLSAADRAFLLAMTNGETEAEYFARCPNPAIHYRPYSDPSCGPARATSDSVGGIKRQTCIQLLGGTGNASGLAVYTAESTATQSASFGFSWPISYTSPDGMLSIFGDVVFCTVGGEPTMRFAGRVIARNAAGAGSGSGCGCFAYFPGCWDDDTGTPPSQETLIEYDETAGTVTFRVDFGCGTFDVAVGPCPPDSPCCDLPECLELVIPDGPAAGTYELTAVGSVYQSPDVPGFTYVQFDKTDLGGGNCRYTLTDGGVSGVSTQWSTAAACDPFGVTFDGSQLGAAGAVVVRECTGLGDCMACDLDGNTPVLVVPDGPNAGTYAMDAWGFDSGGNPVTTVNDFAYNPLLPVQLICNQGTGLPEWGTPGTGAVAMSCGPPSVFEFPGAVWGSTGNVVVTT